MVIMAANIVKELCIKLMQRSFELQQGGLLFFYIFHLLVLMEVKLSQSLEKSFIEILSQAESCFSTAVTSLY